MKKVKKQLELDVVVNDNLELEYLQRPEIWTGDEQVYVMGADGWEEGEVLSQYDDPADDPEVTKINDELHSEIKEMYTETITRMIDDGAIKATDISENVIIDIENRISWVEYDYYQLYKATYSSVSQVPAVNLLCQSPVDHMYLVIHDTKLTLTNDE